MYFNTPAPATTLLNLDSYAPPSPKASISVLIHFPYHLLLLSIPPLIIYHFASRLKPSQALLAPILLRWKPTA